MDKIRKIMRTKFFEAVGDTGERNPSYMASTGPSIQSLQPDDIGILEFRFTDKNTLKDAVDSIYPLITDLGAQYPNYDTEFGLVSMNVPYKSKDKIIEIMSSFGFTFTSETFGNEIRGGVSSYGRLGAYAGASMFAGSGGMGGFPVGYQMTRLIGENEKPQKKILFVDFDGTVRDAIPVGKTARPPLSVNELKVFDGIGMKLKEWKDAGYTIIGISNQAGAIPKRMEELGVSKEEVLKKVQEVFAKTVELINSQAGDKVFTDVYFSKDKGNEHKPGIGLANRAEAEHGFVIDKNNSVMVGDWPETDGGFAKNLGIKYIKVDDKKRGSDFPSVNK
jgi:HAD superfamily hydrolase (TIGR01662 family)